MAQFDGRRPYHGDDPSARNARGVVSGQNGCQTPVADQSWWSRFICCCLK